MVFCFVQKFFFGQHQNLIFFSLHNSTLGYITKTVSDYFFFLHQNQNIFFSNIGNQNIILEKNHNPLFKLNSRGSMWISQVPNILLKGSLNAQY